MGLPSGHDEEYVNKVVSLIRRLLREDGVPIGARTPESYFSYLFNLSDDEILEAYSDGVEDVFGG